MHLQPLRFAFLASLLAPSLLLAQVDAPRRMDEKAPPPVPARETEEEAPAPRSDEPPPTFVPPPLKRAKAGHTSPTPLVDAGTAARVGAADAGVVSPPLGAAKPGVDPKRPPPKPLEVPKVGNPEVVATLHRWQLAGSKGDRNGQELAERDLLNLRENLGIGDLDEVSAVLQRAAAKKRSLAEADRAVSLASTASELAPHSPYARLELARAYFSQDPAGALHYLAELKAVFEQAWTHPRYRRISLGEAGAAALFAWFATAVIVVTVLCLRRLRYFLHDVHHRFFPKAVARWQSALIGLLLLGLPLVFRQGAVVELGVLFIALTLYLAWRERVVLALLIGSLALFPWAVSQWAEGSAFAGSSAEDVYLLENGGLEAQSVAERLVRHSEEGELDFAQLFALAHYEQRRGDLDAALAHYKAAAHERPGDARLMTNMGSALLTKGDVEGAANLYFSATQADPNLAAAFFDTARLSQRRATVMRDDAVGGELERAQTALLQAQELDPTLLTRPDPPQDNLLANRQLLYSTLSGPELDRLNGGHEVGERLSAQLASEVLGDVSPEVGLIYPLAFALSALFFGLVGQRWGVSKACEKCGRPVCRRCDPELGVGSLMCNQCVHAFARKGALSAAISVRKQIEVRRYQSRHEKVSYGLGLLVSGAGHLFNGYTTGGALYAFLFLFSAFALYQPEGLFRAPYAWVPLPIKLVPILLVFLPLYGLSLRGLHRRLNP